MWLSIHAAFTEEGGKEGEGEEEEAREGKGGLRGREVVFLFSLAQREGKTIGVQMDASPLFLDDPPPLHPSFLHSLDVKKEEQRREEGFWVCVCV